VARARGVRRRGARCSKGDVSRGVTCRVRGRLHETVFDGFAGAQG
jgi:hypothetical protein